MEGESRALLQVLFLRHCALLEIPFRHSTEDIRQAIVYTSVELRRHGHGWSFNLGFH